ncbi:MAG: glycosyltransferase family 9 protein, partial [Nanoarchaeota archaeon]
EEKINYLAERNRGLIVPDKLFNLRELYLIFQKSGLVVLHDGGPMHLAWAGNSRLLAFIADYIPINRIKPLGPSSKYLRANIEKLPFLSVRKEVDKILR